MNNDPVIYKQIKNAIAYAFVGDFVNDVCAC